MPSSQPYQINKIVELIRFTNPKSLLDVGVGFGKYGFLSREYLELWDGRNEYNDWKTQIDGIEVFKEYLNPVHDYIYDDIFIGNASDILPTLKTKYDLVLVIDVLEHFGYKEGMELVEKCCNIAKNILISTPLNPDPQEGVFGNDFEKHKFRWHKKHFAHISNKYCLYVASSLIIYIGEDALTVKSKVRNESLQSRKFQIVHLMRRILQRL